MRTFVLWGGAAVAVLAAAIVTGDRAQAVPMAPAVIHADGAGLVQDVAYRRHHRHHFRVRARGTGAHLGGKARGTAGMPFGRGTANSPGGVPSETAPGSR